MDRWYYYFSIFITSVIVSSSYGLFNVEPGSHELLGQTLFFVINFHIIAVCYKSVKPIGRMQEMAPTCKIYEYSPFSVSNYKYKGYPKQSDRLDTFIAITEYMKENECKECWNMQLCRKALVLSVPW